MRALAIVRANLVRTVRDRTALFFSVLLPLILILVLGLTFGGNNSARVGLVDGDQSTASARLTGAITATTDLRIELQRFSSVDALRDAAERGFIQVGLVIPAGYEAAIRSGATSSLTLVAPRTTVASAVGTDVRRAIAAENGIARAARFAAAVPGVSPERALQAAIEGAGRAPAVTTVVEHVDAAALGASSFTTGAQSQLILFMFLTALTGATELVVTRQLGISRRMLATPTPVRTIILGEALARIVVALAQGIFIVVATTVLFGVAWGNLVGTAAIVLVFAAVAGGAAMLVGSIVGNPSQGGALAPAMGMLLGLLGGTMVPAEVFPATMQTLSKVTPHAWAMDAFRALADPAAGLATILPQLGVLAGFAAVLLVVATVRFRHVLAR